MGTIGDKLDYLADTKAILKQKINNLGGSLTDQSTFRSYGDYLDTLYDELPKISDTGTEITLTPTRKGRMQLDLKGNTSQDSTNGYQLIHLTESFHQYTQSGITFETYPDGTCKIYGTSTAIVNAMINLNTGHFTNVTGSYYAKLSAGDYIYNATITKGDLTHTKARSGSTDLTGYGNAKTFTLENDITNFNLYFRLQSNVTVDDEFKIMLEKGSTAHDWEPYTGGQPSPNPDYPQPIHVVTGNNTISIGSTDYPINLGSIELCKIGNYQDYIYKENGNWYKYGAIEKKIFDGTEGWVKSSTTNYDRFVNGTLRNIAGQLIGLCTHLKYNAQKTGLYTFWLDDSVNLTYRGRIVLDFSEYGATTLADFKTWLATNEPEFYIPFATPTSTQITDETLIAQLDSIYNAMSSNGSTTISQTNSDLPFVINATALTTIPSTNE